MSESPFKRLLRYAEADRKRIYQASALSILNKIADLAPPALIGVAVDIVIKEESVLAQWGVEDSFHQLVVLAVLTILVWGAESIFEYAFQWQWRTLAQDLRTGCAWTPIAICRNSIWAGFEITKAVD